MLLNKDWQTNNYSSFLTNQAAFDQSVNDVLEKDFSNMKINDYQFENPTQADIEKVIDLINNASRSRAWSINETLLNIIREEAADYFSGKRNIEDTVVTIQNRVTIYVSERN